MANDPLDFTGFSPRSDAPKTPPVTGPIIDPRGKSFGTPAKAVPPQTPAPPEKSIIEEMVDATDAVKKIIGEGKLDKLSQGRWVGRLRNSFRHLYGWRSPQVTTLVQWLKEISKAPLAPADFVARVEQIEHLLRAFNAPAASGSFVATSRSSLHPATKKVFIIHGHDELNLLRLSQLIKDDFRLTPEVLLDKPGQSATTIDKFEQYAECCSYAIALFTPDDKVGTQSGQEYCQARPNVIFETGWFVGRLGKGRVLILLQDGVKIYSDFDGVNRIQFSGNVRDKFRDIQAELEAAQLI